MRITSNPSHFCGLLGGFHKSWRDRSIGLETISPISHPQSSQSALTTLADLNREIQQRLCVEVSNQNISGSGSGSQGQQQQIACSATPPTSCGPFQSSPGRAAVHLFLAEVTVMAYHSICSIHVCNEYRAHTPSRGTPSHHTRIGPFLFLSRLLLVPSLEKALAEHSWAI